jgi:FKBP-type peptidyl-prolyl cis-trans isomerase FkpA
MSEITRVPLQPVAKGSLTKIWLGVIAAVLVGSGVAYATRYEGVSIETITAGTGASPTKSDVALINYVGALLAARSLTVANVLFCRWKP